MNKKTYKKTEEKKELEVKLQIEIGIRLRAARENAGLTQEAVAEKLSVSKNMYGYYETGKFSLPYPSLLMLCDLFSVSPNIILGYEDKSRVNTICTKYGIKYNTVGYEEIEIIAPNRKATISKTGFYKVLFDVQKDIEEETERLYGDQIANDIKNAFQFLLFSRVEMFNIGEAKVTKAVLKLIEALKKDGPKINKKYNDLIKQGYTQEEAYEEAMKALKRRSKK